MVWSVRREEGKEEGRQERKEQKGGGGKEHKTLHEADLP